ncbi:MAG: DUF4159 domain-containing protein [Planctomycetaceae bacterium]
MIARHPVAIAVRCLLSAVVCLSSVHAVAFDEPAMTDAELRIRVNQALRDGTDWLKRNQGGNGSWGAGANALSEYSVGLTSLAVLALINCDEPVDSEPVQRGLDYLRSRSPDQPVFVYEASLYIMALCAAEELDKDRARIGRMARLLERTQCTTGSGKGLWGYKLIGRGPKPGQNGEDRSNGQFAVLALRDAAYAGIEIDRKVWQLIHDHWTESQQPDGGWGYNESQPQARGSLTAAGLSTLAITNRMLQDDTDVDNDGRPDCCAPQPPPQAFDKGRAWLTQRFTVFANPQWPAHHYYYLYGLERAARLGHVRFFGKHDWYREGAHYLQKAQGGDGSWNERQHSTPVLATSFALLFLSKGLSRVVVNKLDYTSTTAGENPDGDWNRHPLDVSNLIEKIDGLKGWPPRLTSQVLTLNRLEEPTAVSDMNQAPILFISGKEPLPFTDQHLRWLREYIDEGGFIFASANCDSKEFDKSFRDLIDRMFPQGDASLQRLGSDHPVFRSEYPLPGSDSVELYGVDFGCRTSIIYSPEDHGCLWQKWMKHDPRGRSQGLIQRIIRSSRIGTNIVAYATGREPPVKLDGDDTRRKERKSEIDRSLLEIGQLRYRGNWDIAPKALKNLLEGLNETVGMAASPQRRTIPITLSELKQFPMVYMHGRYVFQLAPQEQDALRDYLSRGAVLFADACCGSARFDQSFRKLMDQMYPDTPLKQIPADHELYSETLGGHKIDTVNLRRLIPGGQNASIETRTEAVPPILEGIEIDGRYVVIYSRYDISCALENQASLACDGYEEKDAMRLGINVVLYSMLQDISSPNPER